MRNTASKARSASRKADLWAEWPDGFLCPLEAVESRMTAPCARSDDYAVVQVTAHDDNGEPSAWTRHPPGKDEA